MENNVSNYDTQFGNNSHTNKFVVCQQVLKSKSFVFSTTKNSMSKEAKRKEKALANQKKEFLEKLKQNSSTGTELDEKAVVSFGVDFQINSLPMLINCLQHHQSQVKNWGMRYPQDGEIENGLANCAAMIRWLERFRDNEYVEKKN